MVDVKMILTKHALIRLKQRVIPRRSVELTISYGKSMKRPGKVREYTLNKREARFLIGDHSDDKKAIQDIERAKKISVRADASNDEVITAFHRK